MTGSYSAPPSMTTTTLAILARNGINNVAGLQYFTNGLDTKTQGIDLTADLRLPAGVRGTLDFNLNANYTKNSVTHIGPLPDSLVNSTEPGLLDSVTYIGLTEERPDWRGTFTTQYTLSGFHALARALYYGKFSSAQLGFCDLCRERYGAKTLFDAEIGYRFNQVALSLGVRTCLIPIPISQARRSSWILTGAPRRSTTTTSAPSPGRRRRRSDITGGSSTRGWR